MEGSVCMTEVVFADLSLVPADSSDTSEACAAGALFAGEGFLLLLGVLSLAEFWVVFLALPPINRHKKIQERLREGDFASLFMIRIYRRLSW